MRTWASWTAKTALLAAGFAAAGGGLSGVALAGSPGATATLPAARAPQTPASDPGSGNLAGSGNALLADSGNAVSLPVSLPVDVCGDAAAVLGDSTTGCAGGALAGPATRQAAGDNADAITGGVIQSALAPLSGLAPLSAVTASGPATPGILGASRPAAPTPGSGRTPDRTPGAGAGARDTNVPAASQLAGLGTLPGLADLPSLAGLANMPALNGVTGGGIPMPGTALSAANFPGMSSDSFAALAVGALLAGASALKIAGRRARDRKAGIGAVTI